MKISLKNSNSTKNLKQYCELYNNSFNNNKFNLTYLNWLYNKNPNGQYIGIDCYDENILIGQVGGIPIEFFWKKKLLFY